MSSARRSRRRAPPRGPASPAARSTTSQPRSSSAPVIPPSGRERPGETLTHGFYFSLGHGVGLEVHEPPGLGLAGGETLVAGDVIAIEPGIEGLEGIGGVRFEDLLLITEPAARP